MAAKKRPARSRKTSRRSLGALSAESRSKNTRLHIKRGHSRYDKAMEVAKDGRDDCSEALRNYAHGMVNEILAERSLFGRNNDPSKSEQDAYYDLQVKRFDTENAISAGCIVKKRQFEIG